MRLDKNLELKIFERFFKRSGLEKSYNTNMIYENCIIVTTICGKYTIAEISYLKDNYIHHFLGVSAKNPNDQRNDNIGIKVAIENALVILISKLYI